ncbi:hypothetical protein JRO89_XS14G0026800 [Xanthoceras sorbifolium]|uniref:Uncharacterized protein n=1 Tax=Xanthoceras sorbifolium TaxID=99658 RepID=A0ABQ8H3G8_9ROSI|nr:hypothetical protein JRO89_XS14G0026800 [Xanthoceras sorbifolium]
MGFLAAKACIEFDRHATFQESGLLRASVSVPNSKLEWSFSTQEMEVSAVSSRFNEKQSTDYSTPAKEENMPAGKNRSASGFVNHGKFLALDDIY